MAEKLTGTVRFRDLEGGVWELVTGDGTAYQLAGGSKALRVDGQRVTVKGKVDSGIFGIGMTGPTFEVRSWKKA